jgi:hypothetical protein
MHDTCPRATSLADTARTFEGQPKSRKSNRKPATSMQTPSSWNVPCCWQARASRAKAILRLVTHHKGSKCCDVGGTRGLVVPVPPAGDHKLARWESPPNNVLRKRRHLNRVRDMLEKHTSSFNFTLEFYNLESSTVLECKCHAADTMGKRGALRSKHVEYQTTRDSNMRFSIAAHSKTNSTPIFRKFKNRVFQYETGPPRGVNFAPLLHHFRAT